MLYFTGGAGSYAERIKAGDQKLVRRLACVQGVKGASMVESKENFFGIYIFGKYIAAL